MASLNLANFFFFHFFIYFKFAHPAHGTSSPGFMVEKHKDYLKYTFEPGVKCLGVQYDGKDVWKLRQNSPYPESVYFTIRGNTAFINFGEPRIIMKFESNGWNPVFSGQKATRSLNVLYKGSCENYECYGGHKLYLYKANDDKLFNKVRSVGVKGKEEVIFETRNLLDMVYEVLYDESNPNRLVVTTYHVNGLVKKFTKFRGEKWQEAPNFEYLPELQQDKIDFIIQRPTPMGVTLEKNSKYLKYKFADGVRCLGVEYDGKHVLRSESTIRNGSYPESLYFAIKGGSAIVNFRESNHVFRFLNKEWQLTYSRKLVPKELDIGARQSDGFFKYASTDKVHTYMAKDSNVFDSVCKRDLRSNVSIWSPSYPGEYATKVVYNQDDSNDKSIEIHQLNGLIRKFKKAQTGGMWKEMLGKEPELIVSSDKVDFVMMVNAQN